MILLYSARYLFPPFVVRIGLPRSYDTPFLSLSLPIYQTIFHSFFHISFFISFYHPFRSYLFLHSPHFPLYNCHFFRKRNKELCHWKLIHSEREIKMLGIFKEKLFNAPKELKSPASLSSCTEPKPSNEIVNDFMSSNSSNAFSMCFGNDALLAYSPSKNPSTHQRLFSGLDDIYCVFMGGLHNLSRMNKQYGLSKGTNEAMFITEAYRTLRDRGPYPADQVLIQLEGSFGFLIFDNNHRTVFVASVSLFP